MKVFNPFIWCVNLFKYLCHVESYRYVQEYDPYDFSKDLEYF